MAPWACGRCTFVNHELMNNCEMCDAPKEAAELPHLGEPEPTQEVDMIPEDHMSRMPSSALETDSAHSQPAQVATPNSSTSFRPEQTEESLMDADVGMSEDTTTSMTTHPGGYASTTRAQSLLPEPIAPVVMHSDGDQSQPLSLSSGPKSLTSLTSTKEASAAVNGQIVEKDWSFLDNEVRIVLIGKTGVGKSTTGNNILDQQTFKSSASGSSVTRKCQLGWGNRFKRDIQIIDTPGLFDTGLTNEEITREIVKCIGMTSPGPHAFVLVIRLDRFTEEEKATVDHFINIFGKEMLKYLIVLFTRKDDLKYDNMTMDQYIQGVPENLNELLKSCQYRCLGIDNRGPKEETQQDVVDLLKLVDTMVEGNGGGHYTNQMYEEAERIIIQQEEKHIKESREKMQKEMQRLRDEVEEELRLKDEETQKSLVSMKSKLAGLGITEDDEEWIHVFGSPRSSSGEEDGPPSFNAAPRQHDSSLSASTVKQIASGGSITSQSGGQMVNEHSMTGSLGFGGGRQGDISAHAARDSTGFPSATTQPVMMVQPTSFQDLPQGTSSMPQGNTSILSTAPQSLQSVSAASQGKLSLEAREIQASVERLEREHNESREKMRANYRAKQVEAYESFKKAHREHRQQTRMEMDDANSGIFSRIFGAMKRLWRNITEPIGRAFQGLFV